MLKYMIILGIFADSSDPQNHAPVLHLLAHKVLFCTQNIKYMLHMAWWRKRLDSRNMMIRSDGTFRDGAFRGCPVGRADVGTSKQEDT